MEKQKYLELVLESKRSEQSTVRWSNFDRPDASMGVFWQNSVLQHSWSVHLLEHSEDMNESQKKFKWPWKIRLCQRVQSFVCVPPWRRVTFKFWEMLKHASEVSSARLTLHSTKRCAKFKIFRKKIFLVLRSEAVLSISQNFKVTRLQGCTQTKPWTCWRNFDLSRSFLRFLGLFRGFAVLQ